MKKLSVAVGLLLSSLAAPAVAYDGCHPEPFHKHNSPTQIAGCVVYGTGVASRWGVPGVARNDCEYPWTHCTPIIITNVDPDSPGYLTAVIVTPTMFCDCYTGTSRERLADLDTPTLAALGFYDRDGNVDLARGLYPVSVGPVHGDVPAPALPDTATEGRMDDYTPIIPTEVWDAAVGAAMSGLIIGIVFSIAFLIAYAVLWVAKRGR